MDGSLLDHSTYSHAPADSLLQWLRKNQIPVIPCTSKTRAEMVILRRQLEIAHPFVVENGAAVYLPPDYFSGLDAPLDESAEFQVKTFTHRRSHWQQILEGVPLHLNEAYMTFQQAGIEGIIEMTGLTPDAAQLAAKREYGEPLKWLGSARQFEQFEEYIHSKQGRLLKGGRFVHLGGDCDKGRACLWLLSQYQRQAVARQLVSVALGDSQNDVAMLSIADYAVLIRSPVHEFPSVPRDPQRHIYHTQETGPRGWREGIIYVLKKLGYQDINLSTGF